MMGNIGRRRFATWSIAAAIALSVGRVAAQDDDGSVMRRFVDEVLNEGNVDNLDAIAHPEIRMPDLGLSGIDAFREASVRADEGRRRDLDSFEFAVEVALEDDVDDVVWALALTRFAGVSGQGTDFDVPAFYAAELEDGLIRTLYGTIDSVLYVEQTS